MKGIACAAGLRLALAGLLMVGATEAALGQAQQTFGSPEAAMAALVDALSGQDDAALIAIFGAEYEDEILGDDRDAAREEQARFVAAANQSLELRPDGQDRRIAYVGLRAWPLPIPIVFEGEAWRFDTETGIDELANQRIGGNELRTIDTMRAYVNAQNEYASEDRDGDEVLEYAQHIRSSPGQHDGLYWPTAADQPTSPVGPLLAVAVEARDAGETYNGYHYRILTRQGANPPGGAYDYVINDNMIAGFALIAWPAAYDHSGIMTFIVNHQRKVYEKDLGPDTAEIVAAIDAYDPDGTWTEVAE
jgi:Protein of unknown function (DUF2950)